MKIILTLEELYYIARTAIKSLEDLSKYVVTD